MRGIEPFNAMRHVLGAERRRVDDDVAHQARGLDTADIDTDPVVTYRAAVTGTSERHHRAVRFRISFECEHVFVNVDDAGRRREQRARAIDLRLELTSLLRIEAHQILYTVAPRVAR